MHVYIHSLPITVCHWKNIKSIMPFRTHDYRVKTCDSWQHMDMYIYRAIYTDIKKHTIYPTDRHIAIPFIEEWEKPLNGSFSRMWWLWNEMIWTEMNGKYVRDNRIKKNEDFWSLSFVRAISFVFLIDLLINLMESSLFFWSHKN